MDRMSRPSVNVRRATESDLPSIESDFGGPLDNVGDPFCDITKFKQLRLDWILVAELEGVYAGFVYWHVGSRPFFAPQLERFAHIRQVQVPRRVQGLGVGRKLMDEAIESLKKDRINEIVLATNESNRKARSLYEGLGFREFQKQVDYKLTLGRK